MKGAHRDGTAVVSAILVASVGNGGVSFCAGEFSAGCEWKETGERHFAAYQFGLRSVFHAVYVYADGRMGKARRLDVADGLCACYAEAVDRGCDRGIDSAYCGFYF